MILTMPPRMPAQGTARQYEDRGDIAITVQAYLTELAPEDYALTTNPALATHGLVDQAGDGDWQIVPLAEVDGSVMLLSMGGSDNYLGI